MKQSETRDQTRKGAKIKGSNYNSFGGLITKLSSTESKIFILKLRRFLKEHYSLSPSKKVVFSSKTGIRFAANCSNYGAHFMAAIPLSLYYKATITTAGLSLAYKSQRKTVKRGGERDSEGKNRGGTRLDRQKKKTDKTEREKRGQKKKPEIGEQRGREKKEKAKRERERGVNEAQEKAGGRRRKYRKKLKQHPPFTTAGPPLRRHQLHR